MPDRLSVYLSVSPSVRWVDQSKTVKVRIMQFSPYGKGKGRALDIAPQVDTATAEALRYMARTKQRRTYLPYAFPAIAGTHLPTPRGWRVE